MPPLDRTFCSAEFPYRSIRANDPHWGLNCVPSLCKSLTDFGQIF